jgi:hypothetical protein
MRWVAVFLLIPLGCDSLFESPPAQADHRGPTSAVAGASGSTSTLEPFLPGTLDVGGAGSTPAEPPDWCTEAVQQGAVFCEAENSELEFCVVAPSDDGTGGVASSEGGSGASAEGGVSGAEGGVSGAEGGVSGAEGGVSGAEGGVSGAEGGAVAEPNSGCPVPDYPPEWVRELVIQCYAHCAVRMVRSSRRVDGACCYRAYNVYAGR